MPENTYKHIYADVVAIQYSEETKIDIIKWFMQEMVDNKLSFYMYKFDTWKSHYKFAYRYHDGSYDIEVNLGDWVVKQGDKIVKFSNEEFKAEYGEETETPQEPDSGNSTVTLTSNVLQVSANKVLQGISILGTAIRISANNDYAHLIRINDFSAPSSVTPILGLGIYKWVLNGQSEPTATTTTEYAMISEETDGTKTIKFGPDGDVKFEMNYALSDDKKTIVFMGVESDIFLTSGTQVVIYYGDDTTYTQTVTGTGTKIINVTP